MTVDGIMMLQSLRLLCDIMIHFRVWKRLRRAAAGNSMDLGLTLIVLKD